MSTVEQPFFSHLHPLISSLVSVSMLCAIIYETMDQLFVMQLLILNIYIYCLFAMCVWMIPEISNVHCSACCNLNLKIKYSNTFIGLLLAMDKNVATTRN
jgi:hypothetical protein